MKCEELRYCSSCMRGFKYVGSSYCEECHNDKPAQHPEQVPMAGGKVASSKGPPFHLIPTVALVGLAERFALGEERKGDKAWNAGSNNQECLKDKDFLIERCSHIIHHAMKMRDILVGKKQEETLYENAGAVAWAGAFFLCAAEALKEEAKEAEPARGIPLGYRANESTLEFIESLPKIQVEEGKEYVCRNGKTVGPLLCYVGSCTTRERAFYCKSQFAVDWSGDGNPTKINMSLTDEELAGWVITIPAARNHEGNIGQ